MAENEEELEEGEEEESGGGCDDEPPPCEEGAPGWIVTFGDMMSLLLTFFILLLSFATMETVKYKVLSGSIQVAFGVQEVTPTWTRPQARKIVAREFSNRFARFHIPKPHDKIVARGRRHLAARVDSNASSPPLMSLDGSDRFRCLLFVSPPDQLSVEAGGEHGVVRRERHRSRPAVMPFQFDLLVARQLPTPNTAILSAKENEFRLGIETAGDQRAAMLMLFDLMGLRHIDSIQVHCSTPGQRVLRDHRVRQSHTSLV